MSTIKKRSNNVWRITSGAPFNVTPPLAPTGVTVSSPTAGAIRVLWTTPADDGGGDITHYAIEATKAGDGSPSVTAVVNATDREVLLVGAINASSYTVQVKATNSAGYGPLSTASGSVSVSSASSYTLPNGIIIPSGWDNPKTTGLYGAGYDYGDLTPYIGSLITTADNQIIEFLDITGNIVVKHNNVTIRYCRVHNIQTSPTLIAGEAVVDGNQSLIVNGDRVWLANNTLLSYCEIIGSTDANLNDQTGIGLGGGSGLDVQYCTFRDLSDAILPGDEASVTHNVVYDMKVANGSHSDCLQITDGNNILVQDNVLISLTPNATLTLGGDGVTRVQKEEHGNAAIQLGAQTGTFLNVIINHNYMSGGNYTINSNNSGEATYGNMTGAYTNNVFTGLFFRGTVGNYGSGMTFDNTNVWETTRITTSWAGVGDTIERYWHLTGGAQVNGVTSTGTP
jgi:hypothetical protein